MTGAIQLLDGGPSPIFFFTPASRIVRIMASIDCSSYPGYSYGSYGYPSYPACGQSLVSGSNALIASMAELGTAPHVIEAVVNHLSGTKGGIAGVYNRANHYNERREALELWAFQMRASSASLSTRSRDCSARFSVKLTGLACALPCRQAQVNMADILERKRLADIRRCASCSAARSKHSPTRSLRPICLSTPSPDC